MPGRFSLLSHTLSKLTDMQQLNYRNQIMRMEQRERRKIHTSQQIARRVIVFFFRWWRSEFGPNNGSSSSFVPSNLCLPYLISHLYSSVPVLNLFLIDSKTNRYLVGESP